MLKPQLLILLSTFYIHNSLTQQGNYDLLRTWKFVEEAINVIDDIQKMKSNDIPRGNFWRKLTPLRASLEVKFSKIPFSVEGFDCDISTGNWLITEDSNTSKISEVWNNATDCLQEHEDSIRRSMETKFSETITSSNYMNHGEECIGPIAFDTIHKYYLMMVNFEVNTYVMYAGAWADMSLKDKVEQPTTPKYSDELKSRYLQLTKNLVDAFQKALHPFSANCNGENTAPTQDGALTELRGLYQTAIFQYNYDNCGYFWKSCNHLASSDCNVSWIPRRNHEFFIHRKVCHSLGDVQACFSGSTNRFSYIHSSKLGLIGHKHNCSAPDEELFEVAYNESTPFSACYCQGLNVDWRINLGSIASDTKNNYVIVGVSFILIDRTFTLRAAEGKLRSLGYITDFRWIPLSNFNENFRFDSPYPKISLRKLKLESGHVMTGISLEKSEPLSAIDLTFQIVGAPFDPESGLLSDHSMRPHQCRISQKLRKIAKFSLEPPLGIGSFFFDERSVLNDDFGETLGPLFDAPSLTIPKAMQGLNEIAFTSRNVNNSKVVSFAYGAIGNYDLYNYLRMVETRGLHFGRP